MVREIEDIIADFEDFSIEGDYMQKISKLTDELIGTGKPELALDAMLAILERYPDEEIGSPGPLAHAIEKCPGFEPKLLQSIERMPSTLSIWILYRLIQKSPKEEFVKALEIAAGHPLASEQIHEDAKLLLSWVAR
ncbi:hypothetical protein [Estrella lausannensis]|nr:hypothetical protein [Estrella lausannensis]